MKLQLSHFVHAFSVCNFELWVFSFSFSFFLLGEGRQKTALSVTAQNEIITYFLVKNIRAKIQCHMREYGPLFINVVVAQHGWESRCFYHFKIVSFIWVTCNFQFVIFCRAQTNWLAHYALDSVDRLATIGQIWRSNVKFIFFTHGFDEQLNWDGSHRRPIESIRRQ